MQVDQNRLKRQKEGFQRWKQADCKGSFEWVTGVGKTFAGILSAKYFIKKDPEFSVVVCVPTDVLRTSWRLQAKQHGIEDNFHIDTVHNLVNQDIDCDMLILDEIHMYIGEDAEVFPSVFKTVKADKILGLTATLGHDNIRRHLVDANCPVVDTIDLREAIANGYVSDYIQYNLALELTPEERAEYDKLDKIFYRIFAVFEYDFDMVKDCLSGNDTLVESHARRLRMPSGELIGKARMCMKAIRDRKEFLYECPTKIKTAVDIINKFPDKKFITFGQTTDSADLLADELEDAMSFHSNIPTQLLNESDKPIGRKCGKGKYLLYGHKGTFSWSEIKKQVPGKITRIGSKRVRDLVLERFESGEIRGLCSAKALDVGFDNADIELSVILSGTSNQRQLIQRIGRTIRKKEGKRAIIVQLYIADTQDEKWLNKRQTNTNNVKDIVSIPQITI